MILVIDLVFPPSQENRGDAGKACIWRMTISNRSRMDWRMTSLGLLLDTIPCWWLVALGQAGFTWWNSGRFFVPCDHLLRVYRYDNWLGQTWSVRKFL